MVGEEIPGNRQRVENALQKLEVQGFIESKRPGRRRRIVIPEATQATGQRVGVLLYDRYARGEGYMIDLVHRLEHAGHLVVRTDRTLTELRMNVSRVAAMVEEVKADAWVVQSGSYDVLRWVAQRSTPSFALIGRPRGAGVAGGGPEKPAAVREAVRKLVALGHRRIVMLARSERRVPRPGASEQAFLDELESAGIATTAYHFPDWDDHPEGLRRILGSMMSASRPTAIFVDTAELYFGVEQVLLRHGVRVPEDISLICSDGDPYFEWCRPTVAHIQWNPAPLVRRIVRWAGKIGLGKDDRRQISIRATFVPGGTIGPAPRERRRQLKGL